MNGLANKNDTTDCNKKICWKCRHPGWSHSYKSITSQPIHTKVVDSSFSKKLPQKQSHSKKPKGNDQQNYSKCSTFQTFATQPPFAPASSDCATGRWSNRHTLRYPKSPHCGHQPRWLRRPCCSKPAPPRHVRKMPHGHYILHEPPNLEITSKRSV